MFRGCKSNCDQKPDGSPNDLGANKTFVCNIFPANSLFPIFCERNVAERVLSCRKSIFCERDPKLTDPSDDRFQYPSPSSLTFPRNMRNRKKKYPSARIMPMIHHENPTASPWCPAAAL